MLGQSAKSRKGRYSSNRNHSGILLRTVTTVCCTKLATTLLIGLENTTVISAYFRCLSLSSVSQSTEPSQVPLSLLPLHAGTRSGGTSEVSRQTGISRRAIIQGIKELAEAPSAPVGRVRRPGGGRKKTVDKDASLKTDLERLVDPVTRGDPESPLRWTCKSVRKLAAELNRLGHRTSHRMVAELLRELAIIYKPTATGYSTTESTPTSDLSRYQEKGTVTEFQE